MTPLAHHLTAGAIRAIDALAATPSLPPDKVLDVIRALPLSLRRHGLVATLGHHLNDSDAAARAVADRFAAELAALGAIAGHTALERVEALARARLPEYLLHARLAFALADAWVRVAESVLTDGTGSAGAAAVGVPEVVQAPTTRHALPQLPAGVERNAAFELTSASAYALHTNRGPVDSKHVAMHFDRICEIAVGPAYRAAFGRWRRHGQDAGWHLKELHVAQRLLIGLSETSLWQTGIAFMVAHGAPVLPGPALKGLARSFARRHLAGAYGDAALDEGLIDCLFGSTAGNGQVKFHEAWWVPGSAPAAYGADRAFVREVVTPHHKKFADSAGQVPATPFDNPEPVPQLATHGRFLVALSGATVWADHAMDILQLAVEMEGAGARTPEYGRGSLERVEPEPGAARAKATN